MQKKTLKYRPASRYSVISPVKYTNRRIPVTISRTSGATGGLEPPIVAVPVLPTPSLNLQLIANATVEVGIIPISISATYYVYRNTVAGLGGATLVHTTTVGDLFNDSGLETDTEYYYLIVAQAEDYRDSAPGIFSIMTATSDKLLIDPSSIFLVNVAQDKIKIGQS